MATNFPTALDDYADKTFGSTILSQHMNDLQDSVEAVQGKLGVGIVGGSIGATNSIDWLVRSPSSTDPGHNHTGASITGGISENAINRSGIPLLARQAEAEVITGAWVYTSAVGVEIRGGYGALPAQSNYLKIGGGGGGSSAGSISFGANSGDRFFRIGTDNISAFLPIMTICDNGNIAIGNSTPTMQLQVHRVTAPETSFTGSHNSSFMVTGTLSDTNWTSMAFGRSSTGTPMARIGAERDDNGDVNNLYFGTASLSSGNIDKTMHFSGQGRLGVGDFFETLSGAPATAKHQVHVFGDGYTAGAHDTVTNPPLSGHEGGSIYLQDSNHAAGSGGAVYFGARGATGLDQLGQFAFIKATIADGTPNTVGSLAFGCRAATGNANMSEHLRITYHGRLGINSATPKAQTEMKGTFTHESDGTIPCNANTGYDPVHTGAAFSITDTSLTGISMINHGGAIYFGNQRLFENESRTTAAIRGISRNANAELGALAFFVRKDSADTYLTEAGRFSEDSHLCVGPTTNVVRDAYTTNENVVIAVRGRATSGAGAAGIIELSSNSTSDSDPTLLGGYSWSDAECSHTDKLVATINCVSEGGSAGNRGSRISLTHRDDAGGNALRTSLAIAGDGTLEIKDVTSAPAAPDAGYGLIYLKNGDLYFRGNSGGEQLIKAG